MDIARLVLIDYLVICSTLKAVKQLFAIVCIAFRACSFDERELMIDALLSLAYRPDLGHLAFMKMELPTMMPEIKNFMNF